MMLPRTTTAVATGVWLHHMQTAKAMKWAGAQTDERLKKALQSCSSSNDDDDGSSCMNIYSARIELVTTSHKTKVPSTHK